MRYGYWQHRPYVSRYRVFATPDLARLHIYASSSPKRKPIGEVWRDRGSQTWRAELYTDPLIVGRGRTRDDAVDDAFNQVGGPG